MCEGAVSVFCSFGNNPAGGIRYVRVSVGYCCMYDDNRASVVRKSSQSPSVILAYAGRLAVVHEWEEGWIDTNRVPAETNSFMLVLALREGGVPLWARHQLIGSKLLTREILFR